MMSREVLHQSNTYLSPRAPVKTSRTRNICSHWGLDVRNRLYLDLAAGQGRSHGRTPVSDEVHRSRWLQPLT